MTPEDRLRWRVVVVENLQCGELTFRLMVKFTESPKKDNPSIEDIFAASSAVANVSGGLVTVVDVSGTVINVMVLGSWKSKMHRIFPHMFGNWYQDCVQYQDCEDKGIHLLIKPSQHLITVKSNIFLRVDDMTTMKNDAQLLAKWLYDRHNSPLPNIENICLIYGSVIAEGENQSLEFKHWKSVATLQEYTHTFAEEANKKAFIGLANGPAGGRFVVGVQEGKNEYIIRGQQLDKHTERQLDTYLQTYIESFTVISKDPLQAITLQRNQHYDICFKEVIHTFSTDKNSSKRHVLIIIQFASFEGLVCSKQPESYTVTDEGFVRKMSVEEWRERIMESLSSDIDGRTSLKTQTFPQPDMRPKQSQTQPPITSVVSVASDTPAMSRRDVLLNKQLAKTEGLSYTLENPDWETDIRITTRGYKYNLDKLVKQSDLLKMKDSTDSMNFTPSRDVIVSACPGTDVETVLDDIQRYCEPHSGLAIANRCWTSLLPQHIKSPPGHILDILCITSKPDIHFCVVAGQVDEAKKKEQLGYLFRTSRFLKSCLVNKMNRKHSVSIRCHLKQIGHAYIQGEYQEMISKAFLNPYADTLREALASLLLSNDTLLKHDITTTGNLQMTADQIEKIVTLFGVPGHYNLIEGPPGSGKSIMAITLYKMYPDITAWIVSTHSFQCFLASKGIDKAKVFVMKNDTELNNLISGQELDPYKCVIVDDGHHFSLNADTWQKLFDFALKKSVCLFLFQDNQIQNYKAKPFELHSLLQSHCQSTGATFCCSARLTEIHRNDRKIASYISNNAKEALSTISCANPNPGHDVEIIRMDNLHEMSETNALVKFIKEAINPQECLAASPTAYSPTDIAVLIDCDHPQVVVERITEILTKFVPAKVHNAHIQPPEGITVELVDQFIGLDAKLCIFPELQPPSHGDKLNNPKYRAYLSSRAISRAVFCTPILTCDLTRKFQFGELERLVKPSHQILVDDMSAVGMRHYGQDQLNVGAVYNIEPEVDNPEDTNAVVIRENIPPRTKRAHLTRECAKQVQEVLTDDPSAIISAELEVLESAEVVSPEKGPEHKCAIVFQCKEHSLEKITSLLDSTNTKYSVNKL